jgi:hypothetical protein
MKYGVPRLVSGLVRDLFRQLDGAFEWFQGQIVVIGSISMIVYIFHIYFLSAARLLLVKLAPGLTLPLHLLIGWLAVVAGPLLLFRLLGRYRLFRWSIGLSHMPAIKAKPASFLADTTP